MTQSLNDFFLTQLFSQMNVLVYSGPGTTAESVKHCIESLRTHLSPYYAVVTVGEKSLLNDPWQFKTKALVIPGGADIPYCNSLNNKGNKIITDFVRKGGKYIGFCAGGYYASGRCEFEVGTPMEVSGSRELGFFPGTCRGTAYKGFVYNSHVGARIAKLNSKLPESPSTVFNYYNGGGCFVDAQKYSNVEVLATFDDPVEVENSDNADISAAVVYCKVGKGGALLSGSHPEFSFDANQDVLDQLKDHDHDRKLFLKACLIKLGLKVNTELEVPKLTPIHCSSYLNPVDILSLEHTLRDKLDFSGNTFDDVNDSFTLRHPGESFDQDVGTNLIMYNDTLPDPSETPQFNFQEYYDYLNQLYSSNNTTGIFGKVLGYGEVVTSTSTLLDKNTRWLPLLPHGLVLTATTQVQGRGRGGNVWINPQGVMAQSVLFRTKPENMKSIVTLQYVLGLALIELILTYGGNDLSKGIGYEDMPVRLKWPNDIYGLKPEYFNDTNSTLPPTVDGTEETYAKISGAIVNSQYLNGKFNLVWGAGVNVSNEAPTTSLNLILDRLNELRAKQGMAPLPPYKHELLLAKVMFTVNQFYSVFEHSGMLPFLPMYYKRWFHSNQTVTVTSDGKTRTCAIKGITEDNGLLVVTDINTGESLELQPDGNSFDIFKGLVYRKMA